MDLVSSSDRIAGLSFMDAIKPKYSLGEVRRAGRVLRQKYEDTSPDLEQAFRVAYNWIGSHALPMSHLRSELMGKVRGGGVSAITAARVKRMVSIRRKISAGKSSLVDMQDLGGCRAVVSDMSEVRRLIQIYDGGASKHEMRRFDAHIDQPKASGYRSHHIIMRYVGEGKNAAFKRHDIELQLRTRAQHAWATAVESVGLMRNENLKAGEGCERWLRLFALMAGEMAEDEHQELVPGITSDREKRRAEIADLDRQLKAIAKLDTYRSLIKQTEHVMRKNARFFQLSFDRSTNTITATTYNIKGLGVDRAETRSGIDTVVVEVDSAKDLRTAYPNYFMDVQMFVDRLRKAAGSSYAYQDPKSVKQIFSIRE